MFRTPAGRCCSSKPRRLMTVPSGCGSRLTATARLSAGVLAYASIPGSKPSWRRGPSFAGRCNVWASISRRSEWLPGGRPARHGADMATNRTSVTSAAIAAASSPMSRRWSSGWGPLTAARPLASREELEQAWLRHRDRLMATWAKHGKRPAAWWEFEAPFERPGQRRAVDLVRDAGLLGARGARRARERVAAAVRARLGSQLLSLRRPRPLLPWSARAEATFPLGRHSARAASSNGPKNAGAAPGQSASSRRQPRTAGAGSLKKSAPAFGRGKAKGQ